MSPLRATILAEFATLHRIEMGTGGGEDEAAATGVPRLRAEELGATAQVLALCMRRSHQELAVRHHLEHEGRLLHVLAVDGAGLVLRTQL